jgi:hypothetical protein
LGQMNLAAEIENEEDRDDTSGGAHTPGAPSYSYLNGRES